MGSIISSITSLVVGTISISSFGAVKVRIDFIFLETPIL